MFIIGLINRLKADGKYEIHMIPHVGDEANTCFPDISDVMYYKSFNSPIEAKNLISAMDIFVGSRMHATIAALSSGVPTIPVSYSNKFSGLFGALNYNHVVDLRYNSTEESINAVYSKIIDYKNLANSVSESNSIVSNKILNDKKEIKDRKHIMIIADEFHLFIDEKNPVILRNFGQLARRIRKYSGALVVATQSIKDFVGNSTIIRHATAIFNNCQYQMVGMMKEDDMLAYLELFKQNPLTDTQKNFLLSAKRGEFLLNIDSKTRLRIKIEATELERKMMGE